MGWQHSSFRWGWRRLRNRSRGKKSFEPAFDFRGFLIQAAFVQFREYPGSGNVQAGELPALREQLETTFDGGHPQSGLPGEDPGASRLEMKEGGPMSAARIGSPSNPLEEFGGAAILAFVEGKVRLLQDRRNLLREPFADLPAKHAAHQISSFAWN
jgi:hypothetical protein